MLIIGVLSFTITPISTFSGAFVSEISNACLRLFYMVYIDFITMFHSGIKLFHHTNFGLLVRYRNACLRLFVVLLQDLHCLQRFYHVDQKFSMAFISQI